MSGMTITLYDYFRSSACYRVRIALHLKGLAFESAAVNLLENEQAGAAYRAVNPQAAVPYYVEGGVEMGQSIAIMEYLDAKHPEPPLLRGTAEEQAYIRQLSLLIACEIHGYSQPMVWKAYLPGRLGASEAQGKEWLDHWVGRGLKAYEALLAKYGRAGAFSLGDAPSMADCCLVPQLYAARRFGIDLSAYPTILAIEKNCIALKAFIDAAPESHRDAPSNLEQIHGRRSPILLN